MAARTKSKRIVQSRDIVPKFLPKARYDHSSLNLPAFDTFELHCGLRVLVMPQREIPVWDAMLINPQGVLFDPPEASGCLSFAADVVRDGIIIDGKPMGKSELSQRIERLGASLYTSAGYHRNIVGIRGLSKHRFELIEYLAAAIQNPLFLPEDCEWERRLLLAQIATKYDSPDWYASDAYRKFVYGNHPLGQPEEGTSESIAKISVDLLRDHWHRITDLSKCYLVVTGDCSAKEWRDRLNPLFGQAKPSFAFPEIPDPATYDGGIKALLLNRKNATQATIGLGHRGVTRSHPDYHALQILEQILFNGMSSRFFKIIRAKHGLTYSIAGNFGRDFGESPFTINTATATETTLKMVSLIVEIIEEFQQSGATDSELFDAKSYLCGSYPLFFETAQATAIEIAANLVYDMPLDAITEYRKKVEQVSKADVLLAAQKHIRWDELRILIDGVADEIAPQLKQLNKPIAITFGQ